MDQFAFRMFDGQWVGEQSGSEECVPTMTDEGGNVYDQFDVTLEDSDLLGEVELTTNLIIAASEADEPLSLEEIDRILGVVPHPRKGD
jgi:hypothetical protein